MSRRYASSSARNAASGWCIRHSFTKKIATSIQQRPEDHDSCFRRFKATRGSRLKSADHGPQRSTILGHNMYTPMAVACALAASGRAAPRCRPVIPRHIKAGDKIRQHDHFHPTSASRQAARHQNAPQSQDASVRNPFCKDRRNSRTSAPRPAKAAHHGQPPPFKLKSRLVASRRPRSRTKLSKT